MYLPTAPADVPQIDIQPGPQSYLFGLQFPSINLPPTSKDPSLAYTFTAQVQYGDDSPVLFHSKPFPIVFIPLVDPFIPPPSSSPASSPDTSKKKGKRPSLKLDTAAASTPKVNPDSPYFTPTRKEVLSAPCCQKVNLEEDGRSYAEMRVDLPTTIFLPNDEIIA